MKSDIGFIKMLLYYGITGRVMVGNKIRSREWWENKLQELIQAPCDPITENLNPGLYDQSGNPVPPPIPFEQEMGWSEDTAPYWYGWLKKVFKKRYEREAIAQAMEERLQCSSVQAGQK